MMQNDNQRFEALDLTDDDLDAVNGGVMRDQSKRLPPGGNEVGGGSSLFGDFLGGALGVVGIVLTVAAL